MACPSANIKSGFDTFILPPMVLFVIISLNSWIFTSVIWDTLAQPNVKLISQELKGTKLTIWELSQGRLQTRMDTTKELLWKQCCHQVASNETNSILPSGEHCRNQYNPLKKYKKTIKNTKNSDYQIHYIVLTCWSCTSSCCFLCSWFTTNFYSELHVFVHASTLMRIGNTFSVTCWGTCEEKDI